MGHNTALVVLVVVSLFWGGYLKDVKNNNSVWVFSTDAYSKLCEEATTRLNEFYAQPMQPSVSKFRAASDIDCSDYEELYRSANLFQTWLVFSR